MNNTSSQCNLKPEWTVWKRGMRLSLGHGQIGLARLQQLTRANCALLRVCLLLCLFEYNISLFSKVEYVYIYIFFSLT